MINVKKTVFEYDEEFGKGIITTIFEVTGLDRTTKEVLKWQLKFDVVFEEQHRIELECSRFIKSETVSDLIKEIEIYIEEKRKKIEKTVDEAFELKKFLSIISDAPEA